MAPAHALDAELRGESCNRRAKRSREDVGIWHETYLVPAGCYEAIYSGMPPTGLCRVGTLVPATGTRETARQRSGRAAQV